MEKEADDLTANLVENDNIRVVRTKEKQIRTAVEISEGFYRLIKAVWISSQTRTSDIRSIIESLPKSDIREAEQNSALNVLSKRFRVSKRGGG